MTRKRTTSGKAIDQQKASHMGRGGKRLLNVREALEQSGENPVRNLMRIARKAEKENDLNCAAGIWKELQSYVQAKLKPYDPVERGQALSKQMTLDELQTLKKQLQDDTVKVIDKSEAIDASDLV